MSSKIEIFLNSVHLSPSTCLHFQCQLHLSSKCRLNWIFWKSEFVYPHFKIFWLLFYIPSFFFFYQNCLLFPSFCTISQYPMVQQKQKMTITSVLHIITQCHSSEESNRQAHSNNINNKSPIFKQLSYAAISMTPIHNTHGNTHTHKLTTWNSDPISTWWKFITLKT